MFYNSEGGEQRGTIPLDGAMTARESECLTAMPHEIEIVVCKRTFRVRAMHGDCDTWLQKIGEAIAALRR